MTRILWRGVLAVMLLLASVATASAECAWVLWMEVNVLRPRPQQRGWIPVQGTSALAECERAIDGTVAEFMASSKNERTEKLDRRTLMFESPAGSSIRTYSCFPDTVDPRGPKR